MHHSIHHIHEHVNIHILHTGIRTRTYTIGDCILGSSLLAYRSSGFPWMLVSLGLWVGKSIHVMLRLSLLSTDSAVPMETGKELELGPQHTVQLQHPHVLLLLNFH